VYWELVEPKEGLFDFSLVDGLLKGAREHEMRMVLLWFGTWKNAVSSYVPSWVKLDTKRFPRARDEKGKTSIMLSAFGEETCAADTRAFAAFMNHLKSVDGKQQTVLMVQVENETGIFDMRRDHCEQARAAFEGTAPDNLKTYLLDHRANLHESLRECVADKNFSSQSAWRGLFGEMSDAVFMAWHFASYIEKVVTVGKAEYGLPVYANAYLPWLDTSKIGFDYPCGGPIPELLDVWKAAAPSIDFYAPDIYQADFRRWSAAYDLEDNPLFIPEGYWRLAPSTSLYALGRHRAIGFSPFAIDDAPEDHSLANIYGHLKQILPQIASCQAKGTISAVFQQEERESWEVEISDYTLKVSTLMDLGKLDCPAGALFMELEPDEFLILGKNVKIEFVSRRAGITKTEFLWYQEGVFEHGEWKPTRHMNGDESGHGLEIFLKTDTVMHRVKVHGFS
jgi:hypothetical protein